MTVPRSPSAPASRRAGRWATLWEVAALALLAALAVGTALGLRSGWPYVESGFPWLAAGAVRVAVVRALAGAVVFLALYVALVRRFARRGRRAATASLLATALAAAPVGLAWALWFNLRMGFRPADLTQPFALWPNLRLLALFLALLVLAWAVLLAWTRRRLLADRPAPIRAAAALAGLVVLVIAAPAVKAATASPAKEAPHVIVLLVDALRADHLGTYGYERDTSPALDAFARDGVVFERAISQSTFTKSSVASLFTGRAPYEHGVYWGDRRDTADRLTSDVLPERELTLAEVLRSRGFLTAAWVQNSHLRPYMGFAQGFVSYRDQQGDVERINRRFLGWLRGPARLERVFAYLHYIDLHDPYLPEPPYDTLFGDPEPIYEGVDLAEWGAFLEGVRSGRIEVSPAEVESLRSLYDGQIRHVDDQVGWLLQELRDRGLYDQSLIVLTSDHGDAFMEHGFISHSAAPYDELIHVPLIVKLPGGRHAGLRVAEQVRLIDVYPTVLDLLDVPVPRRVSGCSLLPLLVGERADDPDGGVPCSWAVSEIAEVEDAPPTLGIRTRDHKYLLGPEGEATFDLRQDPGELRPLPETAVPEALAAFRRLAEEIETLRALARSRAGSVELDETTIRELKALGYVE